MVQWLALPAFTATGWGSIPGRGTKTPQPHGEAKKKKKISLKQKRQAITSVGKNMERKENPYTLLVGMYIVQPLWKTRQGVPQKIKSRPAIQSSNPSSRYITKRNKKRIDQETVI